MNAGGVYSQELSINKYIHHLHVQRIIIHLSWEKISATRQSRTQNDRQRYGCDIYHTKFNSYFKTRTRSINSDRLENHNFFFSSIYFLSYESKHAHLRSFKNKGNPCRRIKKTGFVKRTVFSSFQSKFSLIMLSKVASLEVCFTLKSLHSRSEKLKPYSQQRRKIILRRIDYKPVY